MIRLLYAISLWLGLFLLGGAAYAQCHMNPAGGVISRPGGQFEFRVLQGHGSEPIGINNGQWHIKCGAAGSGVKWFQNRSDGGDFQRKIDAIFASIKPINRELTSQVMIYAGAGGGGAHPIHYMTLDFGREGANIVKNSGNPVSFLPEGEYVVTFFGGANISGEQNTVTDITPADRRPIFQLTNGSLPTVTYGLEYVHDPDLPEPGYCDVNYYLGVTPSGTIDLGAMSKAELDSGKETVNDIKIITRRHMSGSSCDHFQSPTIIISADTNLPLGIGTGGIRNEARMSNGTSVFLQNLIPGFGSYARDWGLGGSSAPVRVGTFDPYTDTNETILRLIWKKTPGGTVTNGKAGGTIYLKAEFQ